MADFRRGLSLFVGLLSAFFVVAFMEFLGSFIFTLDVDFEDAAALAEVRCLVGDVIGFSSLRLWRKCPLLHSLGCFSVTFLP